MTSYAGTSAIAALHYPDSAVFRSELAAALVPGDAAMCAKLEQFSLSLPVTFASGSQSKGNGDSTEEALSSCVSSCIAFWGPPNAPITSTAEQDNGGRGNISRTRNVGIGCKDGSVFVLSSSISSTTPLNPPEPVSPPTSPRRYLGFGHPSSRSASPSSTKSSLSPFHVTRSRIVSSVTTEQAEAPKNYVDFEEEQERMKGMLRGKGHRERHSSHSRTRPERDSISERPTSIATGSGLRRDDTRSYLSAALSPTSSTLSLSISAPPSPTLVPAVSPEPGTSSSVYTLRCHVFPPHAGPGRAVCAIKVHDAGRYFTCLLESGGLSVHSGLDGQCIASAVVQAKPRLSIGGKTQPAPPMRWIWRTLLVAASEESIILFACASPDEFYPAGQVADSGSDSDNQVIVAAYELTLPGEVPTGEASLEYLGQWLIHGKLSTIGLRAEHDHSLTLFHVDPSGHLITRSIRVNDALSPPPDLPESHSSTHLPLPNPFKALKSLSTDRITDTDKEEPFSRLDLGEEIDNGEVGPSASIIGLRMHDDGENVRLCAWTAQDILVCDWANGVLGKHTSAPAAGIQDIRWVDHDTFSVLCVDRGEMYRVDATPSSDHDRQLQLQMAHSAPFTAGDAASLSPGGHIVSTHVKEGRRRVHLTTLNNASGLAMSSAVTKTLWKAKPMVRSLARRRISTLLPTELDDVIVGYSDGRICRCSLLSMVQPTDDPAKTSDLPLPGEVVALAVAENPRTAERLLVGGSDDGTIAIWALETLKLAARWTVFTTPLSRVISLQDSKVGRLYGCVLCISQDGTIAVVTADGYQFVYLVPGAAAPLARICLAETNMLLMYTDGRVRLWDTRTREFWRSMNIEKAEELMQEGGWSQWAMEDTPDSRCVLSHLPHASADAASTLIVDVSAFLRQLTSSPALSGTAGPGLSVKSKLEHARALLSTLLTFGISEGIDGICTESLSISASSAVIGLTSQSTSSLFPNTAPSNPWTISPEASADRALAILSVLQYLTQYEDLAQDATTVMTFYAASVGQLVHDSYQSPSLPRTGQHLLHTLSPEIRHAARLLFDAGVARLSDQETTEIVDSWQLHLPSTRPEKERDWQQSALALCVCGFIAVDKYTLLPTSTLTDIAKSIAGYLHDETSPHRSLAIDLCSRGFQVWQQYVDAVEMLRALFTLATTTKKEAIATQNVGAQARTAVLQIAASNTPLFMTTLAIDILHPRSVAHRKAVMQLVIFLVRKKPLVLYANLPRLVEAIVKSLDPNASATRDAVLDSATEILSHVVQTFPTVDFHMGSQRLAVGTSEGAVVMYDLKTATRLYVLEGHKRRTTACSFSPDGRRLVTVSLEESTVLVWKVGSSFTSFFLPGAPPRQGHSGSEPFKTLNFNIGEAAHMSLEATLVNVRFEWPAERSVKLMVKDSTMTFST